jgi:hypothetical protein
MEGKLRAFQESHDQQKQALHIFKHVFFFSTPYSLDSFQKNSNVLIIY